MVQLHQGTQEDPIGNDKCFSPPLTQLQRRENSRRINDILLLYLVQNPLRP
jgi:hypothetical protein